MLPWYCPLVLEPPVEEVLTLPVNPLTPVLAVTSPETLIELLLFFRMDGGLKLKFLEELPLEALPLLTLALLLGAVS